MTATVLPFPRRSASQVDAYAHGCLRRADRALAAASDLTEACLAAAEAGNLHRLPATLASATPAAARGLLALIDLKATNADLPLRRALCAWLEENAHG